MIKTRPGALSTHRIRIRQALRDAARQLVAERGFDAVTVEQITTAANVSRHTFFNYFDSKKGDDTHPVTTVEEILDLFEAGMDPRAASTPGHTRP